MQKRNKLVHIIPCMALTLAVALTAAGCGKEGAETKVQTKETAYTEGGVIGEGEKAFDFTVVDADGKEVEFEVHTDKEMVGEALQELNLIEGEEGDYGLYVKTVNGITVDYDTDGKYWAFYINDEYAMTGVDVTPIAKDESYSFKVE